MQVTAFLLTSVGTLMLENYSRTGLLYLVGSVFVQMLRISDLGLTAIAHIKLKYFTIITCISFRSSDL